MVLWASGSGRAVRPPCRGLHPAGSTIGASAPCVPAAPRPAPARSARSPPAPSRGSAPPRPELASSLLLRTPLCRGLRGWSISPEGPACVLGHDAVLVAGEAFEDRPTARIARVAEGDGDVAKQAASLGALDRASTEALAESLVVEGRELLEIR